MDASRWSIVKDALADALELPAGEREAFLRRKLQDDQELIEEALELLEQEARATPRLEPPGGARLTAALAATDRDPWIGRVVDRWRILERLGAGGMGSVYLAERADGVVDQRAALKLLHVTLASSEIARARFRSERRLLARLEHPGIARLIDGGITDDDIPYLVVEHVAGLPIDRHCTEHAPLLRSRVEIFRGVCDAVGAAHAQLVVHRDLKPSNVLVDGQGKVRLLDFGISKLLDADDDAPHTETGMMAMTPRYASPEQVSGEPIGTASDVYSLGVMLYELLTGRSPYDLERLHSPTRIAEWVCRAAPELPSTAVCRARSGGSARVDPARWSRDLAGDLDTIVMKALAKDPARRYESANQLGLDLGRWLAAEPVLARPDSLGYRASRFARRNRGLVAAGALALVALVAGSTWALIEARAARAAARSETRARELADRRFAQAQDLVRTLLYGVLDRVAPLAGATDVREFIARETLAHVERLAGDGDLTPALRDDLAATLLRLGEVQGSWTKGGLGDVDSARASTERALELLESALAEAPDDPARLDRVASAERQLGDLERIAGRPELAFARYERQRELAERALRGAPEDPRARRQLALALGQAGRLHLDLGRPSAAVDLLADALRTAEDLCAREPRWTEARMDAVLRACQLGSALTSLGRAREALDVQRAALERISAACAEHPENAQLAATLVSTRVFLSETELALGDLDGAERSALSGLREIEPLRVAAPRDVLLALHEIQLLERLGQVAFVRQDPATALPAFERAREVARTRRAWSTGDRAAVRDYVRTTAQTGTAHVRLGASEDAESCFRDALEALGDPEGSAEEELAFHCRIELGEIEGTRAGELRAAEILEHLVELARESTRLHSELDWPRRNTAIVTWRLGTLLEKRGAEDGAARGARARDLRRAAELFGEGHRAALELEGRGQLRPHEAWIPDAFRADVERCEAAALRLGDPSGS